MPRFEGILLRGLATILILAALISSGATTYRILVIGQYAATAPIWMLAFMGVLLIALLYIAVKILILIWKAQ